MFYLPLCLDHYTVGMPHLIDRPFMKTTVYSTFMLMYHVRTLYSFPTSAEVITLRAYIVRHCLAVWSLGWPVYRTSER
jgi:hypothetical protein